MPEPGRRNINAIPGGQQIKMRILRVFPCRTVLTPRDDMAFIGVPPMDAFRPEADEVHVSCAFTWDIKQAEYLKQSWERYYPIVKIGGPAFDSPVTEFTPGMYVKKGVTFTSRGCNNHCEYCLVPDREGRLIVNDDFPCGNIINDNNLMQTGKAHISKVIQMLKAQNAAIFSGGIEADLVTDWFADELRSITVKQLFLACDTDSGLPALRKAAAKLPFLDREHKLKCYVMIGRETIAQATARLEAVWEAGAMPFAQLYQPKDKWINYSQEWLDLRRRWSRPAITKAINGG